jgi:RNA polymerase sigma factor (sigma-70 family)
MKMLVYIAIFAACFCRIEIVKHQINQIVTQNAEGMLIFKKMTYSTRFSSQIELYQALINTDKLQEDAAFDYIYQELYGSFRQWVFAHNGSDQDAEDAFQHGLLNFMQNVREGKYQYQTSTKITTVVFDYCKKKWLNELDSSRLKTKTSLPDSYDIAEYGKTAQDELERNEIVNAVRLALGQLKGDCQKVIEWFYIEELSIKEIAQKLNMKETSTKQKRFDCTEKLKGIFLKFSKNP